MNMQEKIDELRKANKPKEEQQELSKIYDPRSNKYYGLSDNQFRVALGEAYINLYRLTVHENPSAYERDKKEILSEVDLVLREAGRRFPELLEIFGSGKYYKDPDVAKREKRLMPFLCEAAKKDRVLASDVERYMSWRDGKDAIIFDGKTKLIEAPFNNEARWPHLYDISNVRNPYKAAKNVLSPEELAIEKAKVDKALNR